MSQGFKQTKLNIVLENLSRANNGFALSDEGERVFIGNRIVEAADLREWDYLQALCIPNYEERRADIPWRCIRIHEGYEEPQPEKSRGGIMDNTILREVMQTMKEMPRTPEEIEGKLLHAMDENPDQLFWTTKELAEDIEEWLRRYDSHTVSNALNRLFIKEQIVKADVHSKPNQGRASWTLWARTIESFR